MTDNAAATPRRYVSFKELSERTTLCRATIYNIVERGELPPPERLTPRRVGWPVEVVDAWLASRPNTAAA